jgi:aconitate hydratase
VAAARRRLGRPLTYTEKVLAAHARDAASGRSLALDADRVALQDVSAQMTLLQLMTTRVDRVAVPTALHCDHLVRAHTGAAADLADALGAHDEVYEFLRTAAARYGIGFWPPGSGIIHQVTLEHHAFPGGLLVGTDSHTPNAGGLGMLAIGVGGADAVDVLTGAPLDLREPELIGVRLSGALDGWAAPKDVILEIAGRLGTSGATGAVIEYFGPGAATLSATGKATICNMGAELGATTSIFPFDERIAAYLEATDRAGVADAARAVAGDLRADPEVDGDPARFFARVVEVDLAAVEPRLNGPDSPAVSHTVAEVGAWARSQGVPTEISSCLVGSCTNSSYEDLTRAASVARQAAAHGLRARTELLITPGSETTRATLARDGVLAPLEAIGATVLANACGPCIGQWERAPAGTTETIVTSYNRNFPGRNDGRRSTKAFVASPEVVVALALAGTLDLDPRRDAIDGVRLDTPAGVDLPARGYASSSALYIEPLADGRNVRVAIAPDSERIQRLEPWPEWDGADFVELPVLLKAKGTCTTDAISAAGPWLRFRGHLDKISANLFLGAVNAFTGETGSGTDPITGERRAFPDIARGLADAGVRWCVIGDHNYGEGSSREFAAMEPRLRGCVAVIARSFPRLHETNLKKHGVLPLVFADPADYDDIGEADRISILGLDALAPGRPVRCLITRPDGATRDFTCMHSLSDEQIEWFRAGGSLRLAGAR